MLSIAALYVTAIYYQSKCLSTEDGLNKHTVESYAAIKRNENSTYQWELIVKIKC